MNLNTKEILDQILEEFKAQPVGSGYVDVIVSRENYQTFAKSIIESGFEIKAISWWEYVAFADGSSRYGMGGPRSRFYPGWFAEACTYSDDEIQASDNSENDLNSIIYLVENKVLGVFDGRLISFSETPTLTPAFTLDVDESWTNMQ